MALEADFKVEEKVKENEIIIETEKTGRPLLVKVSYHPNWRIEGADKIYLVSPSFMMLIPKEKRVRMYFARRWPDHLGIILTILL